MLPNKILQKAATLKFAKNTMCVHTCLAEIEAGNVGTIITKDLSRLGHNSSLTGLYINYTFPQHDVRYIAINDHFDSINTNNTGRYCHLFCQCDRCVRCLIQPFPVTRTDAAVPDNSSDRLYPRHPPLLCTFFLLSS